LDYLPVCLCVSSPSSLAVAWWTHSHCSEYTCNNGRFIRHIVFYVSFIVSKESRRLILHRTSCLIKEKSCRGNIAQPNFTRCHFWVMQGSCFKWMTNDSAKSTVPQPSRDFFLFWKIIVNTKKGLGNAHPALCNTFL
jgi:hypothetical protein